MGLGFGGFGGGRGGLGFRVSEGQGFGVEGSSGGFRGLVQGFGYRVKSEPQAPA